MNAENLTTVGLIAVMIVGFYFLVIRPTRNRQKEQARTQESATEGARVMTASGVLGTVVRMGEKQALLEVSPGVTITVVRQAIVSVLSDDDPDEFGPNSINLLEDAAIEDPDPLADRDPLAEWENEAKKLEDDYRSDSSANDEEKPPGQR